MNGMNFVWEPESMTIDELNDSYIDVLMAFYRRPKIGWYYTKFTLKHPQHFARLVKFLLIMMAVKLKSKWGGGEGKLQVQHEL